ncbi:MAG: hypothetical protein CL760_00235 [Chloroflexi bacterium]|nr:hypothetical protein [Chloroflexota bacterium]|tara:strand:+ start:60390 stop:61175 length:786 start_codon:yes stop_codon:yes gene_type:complete
MNFFNTVKLLSLISLVFATNSNANTNEETQVFNKKKLGIVCDFFSDNKSQCEKEAVFLIQKARESGIIKHCFESTNNIEHLSNCLTYKYNPLIVSKYEIKRNITPLKELSFKTNIKNCNKNSNIEISKCFYNNYLFLEKGKNKNYWIENYCLFNTDSANKDITSCVKRIKNQGMQNNELLGLIQELTASFERAKNIFKKNRERYFNEAYQDCAEEYEHEQNIYYCIEKSLAPVKKDFINANLKSISCSNKEKIKDFQKCVN